MENTARNWAGILGVCLVFALGMVSGAAVTIQVLRARAERVLFSGQAGDTIIDRVSRRLSSRLRCDARQEEEIHAILQDSRRDLRQVRQQIAPQLRAVIGDTAKRIRAVLREDQTQTFDAMLARTRAHNSLAGLVPPVGAGTTPPPAGHKP